MDPELSRALETVRGWEPTAANLSKARTLLSPELAREAFAQWELRRRAKAKFERAEAMWFTREALEQATHEQVAAYHASLFPVGAPVADLTVGIGGDMIALAARGPAVGFEIEGQRAEMARHNLQVHGVRADVEVRDGMEWLEGTSDAYVFVDPSRRVEGRRTRDPDQFAPDPAIVAKLAGKQRLVAMKLSPLLNDAYLESLGPRLVFVSYQRECREALVLMGKDAAPGRFAVRLPEGDLLSASPMPASCDEPGTYLYDADPGAVRAHALGTLCRAQGLEPLADSNGYLTGHGHVESPWLQTYRVLYMGAADLKKTKAELARLGSATPELKQRGTGLDLTELRKKLKGVGKRPLLVAIYPRGRSIRHAILERYP